MPRNVLDTWKDKPVRGIVELVDEVCPVGGEAFVRTRGGGYQSTGVAYDQRTPIVLPKACHRLLLTTFSQPVVRLSPERLVWLRYVAPGCLDASVYGIP